jgi:serine protease Do
MATQLMKPVLKHLLIAAALAGTTALSAPAFARAAPDSFADLVAQVQPAVVNISTITQVEVGRTGAGIPGLPPGHPLEQFFKRMPQDQNQNDKDEDGSKPMTREARSLGSGFIIDASGYIVTNNHVITGQDEEKIVDKIRITLGNNEKYDARVVGRDAAADLALLKIDAKKPLPFVKFGNSDVVRVGDWALAVGNPFGVGQSVTAGIVSALHRDVEGAQYPFFIQTDASINRGNSGGPMFNTAGDVIGINSAIYSPSGGNVGIGFSIPASYATKIIDQLKANGRVKRGYLGVNIQSLDEDTATGLGLASNDGAAIVNVNPNTPASKAGLKVGDIITAFNGKKVSNSRELSLAVSETPIGSAGTVDLIRDGKPTQIKVVVGDLPGGDPLRLGQTTPEPKKDEPKSASTKGVRQSLGLSVGAITDEIRTQLKLDKSVTGVIVTGLNQNSDAAQKGLAAGDVIIAINRTPINTPEAAAAVIDAARKAGQEIVALQVRRGDNVFFRGIKLQPQPK